ncbi:MAG: hypothetical protein WBS20_14365 [Lysobacterales bacterium]
MQHLKTPLFFVGILCTLNFVAPLLADTPAGLVERLRQTRAVNINEVLAAQFSHPERARGFIVADPYAPRARNVVESWQLNPASRLEVCALRFTGERRQEYELRGFKSPEAAAASGFTVTHQGRCGSCSTLKDLAVYLATTDLTTPARQCARRFGISRKKQCFAEVVGFTPYCAESWAYNARQTKDQCLGTCVKDYGLLNLLFSRYPGANVNESGQLRPCLECDEEKSGPGFKYSAGRTRRNSGIESAIPRPESDVYPLDHSTYFH